MPVPVIFYRIALIFALVTITALALIRVPELPFSLWDKFNHALAFATLLYLADQSFPDQIQWVRPQKFWGLFIYGILIELAQSLLPYRIASTYDVLANTVGLLSYTLCKYCYYYHFRKTSAAGKP